MNARLYEARAGIFTSVDSVFADMYRAGGLNAYGYVYGNPFSFIDPTGMSGLATLEEGDLDSIVIPSQIDDGILLQLQEDMRNRLRELDLRQRGGRAALASFAIFTSDISPGSGIGIIRNMDNATLLYRDMDDSLVSSLGSAFIAKSRKTINDFYFDPVSGVFGFGSLTYGLSMAMNVFFGAQVSKFDVGVSSFNGLQSFQTVRGLDALSVGLEESNLSLLDVIQYQGVRRCLSWFEKKRSRIWWDEFI